MNTFSTKHLTKLQAGWTFSISSRCRALAPGTDSEAQDLFYLLLPIAYFGLFHIYIFIFSEY